MVVKKIIKNVFEQFGEASKDMAKSSVQQIKETLSPWEMIRNSFGDAENKSANTQSSSKEIQGQGKNNTPLNFDKLQESYKNQDQKNIDAMKQRLFQLVKRDDEKTQTKREHEKVHKEQSVSQEEAENKRRQEEQKRRYSLSDAPEGKSGRGTALMGKKKKRRASEPQPAETKPGGGKQ